MIEEIKEILKSILDNIDINQIKEEDNLYSIGLDSLNVINLIVSIESKYNIKFDDEDIELKNWKNISTIKNIINKKLCFLDRGNVQ